MSYALAMGTPLWTAAAVNDDGYMTGMQAVLPEDSDPAATPVFAGVTIRHQEYVGSTLYTALQRTGFGLCQVMGPANVGDTLVQSGGNPYLVSQQNGAPAPPSNAPVAATLQQAVPDSAAHLVMVRFGQGGGSAAPASGIMAMEVVAVNSDGNTLTCGGIVTKLTLTGGGAGAASSGNLVFTAAPAGGTTATGTFTAVAGVVQTVTLTGGGSGYAAAPTVTVPSSTAAVTATLNNAVVALPRLLQKNTYDGMTIILPDGTHSYAFSSVAYGTIKRIDTSEDVVTGTIVADAIVWPPYLASSGATPAAWATINVCTPAGGTGVTYGGAPVTYMESGTERRWMNVSPICYAGSTAYLLTESNPTGAAI